MPANPFRFTGSNRPSMWTGLGLCAVALGSGLVWTGWAPVPGWMLLFTGLAIGLALWPHIDRALRSHDLAMAGSHDGLFEWDPLTKRLQVGQRLLDILGYAENHFPTSDAWMQVVHPDDRSRYNQAVKAHLQGVTDHFYCEYRVRAQNGEYLWLAARGLVPSHGQKTVRLMAGSVTNITERVMREKQAQQLALTDHLTGLPNRRALLERLPAALAEARRKGHLVGLLFVDLDRFKHVNDTLGHGVGDVVLRQTAMRLPSALRAYDLLARQGGDELIVLLTGLKGVAEAEHVAQRLVVAIAAPFEAQGHHLTLSASVGLAMFPDDGPDSESLLRQADMAMYEAKRMGGGRWQRYLPDMDARMVRRVSLENQLRHAVAHNELHLHFQPQFDVATGQLVGAEALLRWTHQGQNIPPDVFIPVAEESDLIHTIGQWVMHSALTQLKHWEESLPPGFRMGVNLSPLQFKSSDVDADWIMAVTRHGVDCDQITLEITESVLLDTSGKALSALQRLRSLGMELALDDFGTGYSSLSYLSTMELDQIKIDKSFVNPLGQVESETSARRSTAVVDATLGLARAMGYRVVAEGVETAAQLEWLRVRGCDKVQGYLTGRPMAADAFEATYLAPSGHTGA